MAKYWCKACQIFVDENPIAKRQHEESSHHKRSLTRKLNEQHKKNQEESRKKRQVEKELRELNPGKTFFLKQKEKNEKKTTETETEEEKKPSEVPQIGEWSTVETKKVDDVDTKDDNDNDLIVVDPPKKTGSSTKKLTAGDLETKNWDLSTKKHITTSLDSEDEDTSPRKTAFKKRKLPKK